jgi:site-specific recombinase XerD
VNSKNSLLNKYLNILANMAGITKKVSMHIARHSFANIARQKKANVYDISKALGHSSLKITETYLSKFDTTSQDATMKQVFEEANKVDEVALLKQLQSLNPETLAALLQKVGK